MGHVNVREQTVITKVETRVHTKLHQLHVFGYVCSINRQLGELIQQQIIRTRQDKCQIDCVQVL